MSPGEKRRRQRKRDADRRHWAEVEAQLRSQGSCCGNCRHFEPCPWLGADAMHCSVMEDDGAYVQTKAHKLCVGWKGKP